MNKFVALTIFGALAACDPGLGASRVGDTITRTGTLDCNGTDVVSQTLVQGTQSDPVRCGPQSQPLP